MPSRMKPVDLLPDLGAWNEGRGISPLDYLFCLARSDTTTACIDLFWPEFVTFEDYVFRAGFEEKAVRAWQRVAGITRRNIEAATNFLDVGSLFRNASDDRGDLVEARARLIGSTLVETYTAKLVRDFPERSFHVELLDDEDDLALVFYQL